MEEPQGQHHGPTADLVARWPTVWQGLQSGTAKEIPGPQLPASRTPQPAATRMVRQLHRDNGGVVYDVAVEAAQFLDELNRRLAAEGEHVTARNARAALDLYAPLAFVTAQAIALTAERRLPALVAQRR